MDSVLVSFSIGETKIKTLAIMPNVKDSVGVRVMTINNAVSRIKKDLGLDIFSLLNEEDVYNRAVIEYQ